VHSSGSMTGPAWANEKAHEVKPNQEMPTTSKSENPSQRNGLSLGAALIALNS